MTFVRRQYLNRDLYEVKSKTWEIPNVFKETDIIPGLCSHDLFHTIFLSKALYPKAITLGIGFNLQIWGHKTF